MRSEAPNLGDVARTYQVDRGWRLFYTYFSIALVAFLAFMSFLHLGRIMSRPLPWWDVLLMDAAGAAFSLACAEGVNKRVTLREHEIEIAGWLTKQKLPRENIRGYKVGQTRLASYYILVLHSGHDVKLPVLLEVDAYFESFIAGLPQIEKQG